MNDNPIIKINMLGGFSITVDDKIISDQVSHSKKLFYLLEYLISFRHKEISQNELIDLLWPGNDSTNPGGALKTLLHRVRKLLAELNIATSYEFIIQRRGTYGWNSQLNCTVDADEFENKCKQTIHAATPEEKLTLYLQAIDVYKGDFLPKTSLESWVVPINAYYHNLYLKMVHEAIDLLLAQNEFKQIINICWQALTVDSGDEDLHYQLIYSMYRSNDRIAAIEQYSRTTELFFNKFGITPSEKLKLLYKEIIKDDKELESDLDDIKDTLRECIENSGAFYCEYAFFKDIYRLEARANERSGNSIYLCLITVKTSRGRKPEQSISNKAMKKLHQSILESLRCSDVFSRYSVTQYILMLPTTTYEAGEFVLDRIVKSFKDANPKLAVVLQYKLLPLDPLH